MGKIYLFIGAILLTLLLLSPQIILQTCPKGLTYDTFPGQCPLFADQNQDGLCDIIQGVPLEIPSQFDFSYGFEFTVFLALFIMAITFLFVKPKPWIRYVFLFSIFCLLFFVFRSFCPISTLQLLFLQKDRIVLNIFPFLIFLLSIITTIIFGRVFCGWICPIGAFQELVYRAVSAQPFFKFVRHPEFISGSPGLRFRNKFGMTKVLGFGKYLILILMALTVIYYKKSVFCKAGPFGILFGCNRGLIYLFLLLVTCLLSLVIFRFFCRFLCPLGALLSLFSKISIFKTHIDLNHCDHCQICQQKCLIGAIDENQKVDQGECLRCQECLKNCPKGAISFRAESRK